MSNTDLDLIERMVASSPPLLVLCVFVVAVLWRKLGQREVRMDAMQEKTLAAMQQVTVAVQGLADEIRGRR
jgi:hypothetical protein